MQSHSLKRNKKYLALVKGLTIIEKHEMTPNEPKPYKLHKCKLLFFVHNLLKKIK